MNKRGRYTFQVAPFQGDASGQLPLHTISNQVLNAADYHAKERGFGQSALTQSNAAWVLSRFAIEMKEQPQKYETFYIDTWIEGVFKLFTSRNFRIVGEREQVLGYARTIWAMIDVETRKPLDLTALYGEDLQTYICSEESCPIEPPCSIRLKTPQVVEQLTPKYSDIDFNGHFNSVKYMEHVLNTYPMQWHAAHKITRIDMAYIAEAMAGEPLTLLCDGTGFEFRKTDGGAACRARISSEITNNVKQNN